MIWCRVHTALLHPHVRYNWLHALLRATQERLFGRAATRFTAVPALAARAAPLAALWTLAESFWERAAGWLSTPLARLDAREALAAVGAAGERVDALLQGFQAAAAERAEDASSNPSSSPATNPAQSQAPAEGAGADETDQTPRGAGGVSFAPAPAPAPAAPLRPTLVDGATHVAAEVRALCLQCTSNCF